MTTEPIDPSITDLLSRKTFIRFADGEASRSLPEHIHDLFSEQMGSWQRLQDAYEVLKTLKTRAIFFNGFSVSLYNNPGRLTSATAAVGQKDVRDRPCFLCLHNLPLEQKGILYREEFIILYNPMPVFPNHLTVAHVGHRPQSVAEYFDAFLSLAEDLGKKWTTLYNGPRCGASAPDHLHFQALPEGRLPIEHELRKSGKLILAFKTDGARIYTAQGLGREVIVLVGKDRESMIYTFKKALVSLRVAIPTDDEPMMNLAGFHDGKFWHIALFPRRKHRPDAFFREGDERVVVSPGAVEMAGVLVTPMERDYYRLDAQAVESIYQEVSLDKSTVIRAIEAME